MVKSINHLTYFTKPSILIIYTKNITKNPILTHSDQSYCYIKGKIIQKHTIALHQLYSMYGHKKRLNFQPFFLIVFFVLLFHEFYFSKDPCIDPPLILILAFDINASYKIFPHVVSIIIIV